MSARFYVGSHRPMAAVDRSASLCFHESVTYQSGLERFFQLLDGHDPRSARVTAASAAVVCNVEYFQLARSLEQPCDFAPVAGWTWSQSLWSLMELAGHTARWMLDRELDPQHDRVVHLWNESLALSFFAELTARTHLLPSPYLAFQAGMVTAVAVVGEQLRLMEQDDRCVQASLSQASVRQLEALVVHNDLSSSLSLVQVIRKGSYLGPWSSLALAHRLARPQVGLSWLAGLLEPVEILPSTRVLEKCLRISLRQEWPRYIELAERIWQTAIALERRGRLRG